MCVCVCMFGWGGVFKVIIPVSKTTLTASWQQQQEDKKTERLTRGGRKLQGRQTDRGSVKKAERDGEKRGAVLRLINLRGCQKERKGRGKGGGHFL